MTTFTYKCVDCGTKNDTTQPPPDNMLQCKRCGWPTVQTCEGVKRRVTNNPSDRNVTP